MPQALVTTKPNQPRTIVSTEFGNENGWVGLSKHFHLLGIWQWLAWNRLKFFSNLLSRLAARDRKLQERRSERELRRSYIKHHKHRNNEFDLYELLTLYVFECGSNSYWAHVWQLCPQPSLAQSLKPPPCFRKGLSGLARTDGTVSALVF